MKERVEKVKHHILEDVNRGWMVEMDKEEAMKTYGEDLQAASLNAL